MATFLETPRFPDCISKGSTGGPRWNTVIVMSGSGYEQRDQRWQDTLHEYNAEFGIKRMSDLEQLKEFYLAVRGPLYGFRYKDWADYKSCAISTTITGLDQTIGVGDGSTTEFQLIKQYKQGFNYDRPISKPVIDTVEVALNGVPQPTGRSIDTTTGIITFDTAPANNVQITAGYEFDVPCRFVMDTLQTQLELYDVGTAQTPLVEIRI